MILMGVKYKDTDAAEGDGGVGVMVIMLILVVMLIAGELEATEIMTRS